MLKAEGKINDAAIENMLPRRHSGFTLIERKSEGFRVKASKGEAVVWLLRTLGNAGSEVLRLSPKG
jgi:hypothetical protein